MDSIKIENFFKTHAKTNFPSYISLDIGEAACIQSALTEKVMFGADYDGLSLVNRVNSLGIICDRVNAEDNNFAISKLLLSAGLTIPEYVYLNWYRYDNVDKIEFADIDKYFHDIWYPGSDDIDIFDDSLAWILSVSHFGQVKLLRI